MDFKCRGCKADLPMTETNIKIITCQYCRITNQNPLFKEETVSMAAMPRTTSIPAESRAPALKINPNYSMSMFLLLSFFTFGIYAVIWYSKISTDINTIASRYDGKRTMNGALMILIISWLTFGIGLLVWEHHLSDRIGNELRRRQSAYKLSAADFWIWGVFGILIIIGPLIYIHKKCVAMNTLAADYNING